MDAGAVRAVMEQVVVGVRNGKGPILVEAETYRFCGHSRSDRLIYRSREEEAGWRKRDPIDGWAAKAGEFEVEDTSLEKIREEVELEIAAAVSFAMDAEQGDAEDALMGVWA